MGSTNYCRYEELWLAFHTRASYDTAGQTEHLIDLQVCEIC
jgi:hypothetical protein